MSKAAIVKATPIEVSADLKIDNKSMIDIQISAAEDHLLAEEKRLSAEMLVVSGKLEVTGKKRTAELEKIAKSKQKAFEKAVLPALKKFGFGRELQAKVVAKTETNENRIKIVLTFSIEERYDSRRANVRNTIGRLNTTKRLALTKSIKDLNKKDEELSKLKTKIHEDIMQAKHYLSNIPRMERKAKANLAKEVLKTSVEGRAILSSLDTPKALITG